MNVTTIERRTKPGMMPSLYLAPGVQDGTPARSGWYAEIESDGRRIEVSRLDGETQWIADSVWGPGSYPVFVNGFGSRCTILRTVTDEIAALLDNAVGGSK